MNAPHSLRSLLLLAALLPLGGCIAVAAVAVGAGVFGVISYTQNEALRDFKREFEPTFDASLAALKEVGYPEPSKVFRGKTEGKIEVDDVEVHVARHPGDYTRVSVRVGTFRTDDHKRKAKLILEDVAKRLGE
jgi:hypothetical protein